MAAAGVMLVPGQTRDATGEAMSAWTLGLECRVLEALQKLLARCLRAPEVDLIDTGSDPGTGGRVLQVHVRNPATRFRLGPFEDVDGFPVRVIVTEADLEA
jgi:hypothetical protein